MDSLLLVIDAIVKVVVAIAAAVAAYYSCRSAKLIKENTALTETLPKRVTEQIQLSNGSQHIELREHARDDSAPRT